MTPVRVISRLARGGGGGGGEGGGGRELLKVKKMTVIIRQSRLCGPQCCKNDVVP